MNKNQLKGLLCGFIATMFWASYYPVNRYLFGSEAENFDEWFISYLRIFIAFLVLLPLAWKSGDWKQFKSNFKLDWKIFLLLSFATIGEGLLLFFSLKYTTAARSSIFANTSPVTTLIFSFLIVHEVINRRKLTGIILGMTGIVLAALSRGEDLFSGGASMWIGDLLAFSSGVCWALFTVLGTKVSERYNGMFCAAVFQAIALVLLIPVLILLDCRISFDFPLTVWIGVIYLGACANGLAVGLWSQALKHLKPGVLGAFGYVSAVSSIIFATVFLKEKISWLFIVAVILIMTGVSLLFSQKKEESEKEK